MEKVSFVKNGVLRLPPGFRFHPTDEELVVQYLKRKVYSSLSPAPAPAASFIPDVDVCKSDPWDLPGELGKERYFFSTREAKYPNGNRSNRATLSGYWKATGKDKSILAAASAAVVGMKKTLVFYRGKPPHGSRSDWIMHEYRLLDPHTLSSTQQQQQTGDWVLCRIFLKKRNNAGSKNDQDEDKEEEQQSVVNVTPNDASRVETPVFYDFLARDRAALAADLNLPAPSSSSSASSDVTQLSRTNTNTNNDNPVDEGHEESSSYSYNFSSPTNKL